MSSTPRHRAERSPQPVRATYEPPVPVRSLDFDAVAPVRRTPHATEAQSAPAPLQTSDALRLTHS